MSPQLTATSTQPYRRHLLGLPLQQSLFSETGEAVTTMDFPGLTTASDFPASLDDGDLYLDRAKVAALSEALLECLTEDRLNAMRAAHVSACDQLLATTDKAAREAASLHGQPLRKLLQELADDITLIMSYGVMSKFVPDLLLRARKDAGEYDSAPFPNNSAGSEILRNTFALYQACLAAGYSPRRLRDEWPRVSVQVKELLTRFCSEQRGFGPLPWDSPGYEDPQYVARILYSAFDQVDPEQVRQRLALVKTRSTTHFAEGNTKLAALRETLAFWLEFLEWETWYVRRAFYLGVVPLLKQLTLESVNSSRSVQSDDLLFLTFNEITSVSWNMAIINERRDRYLKNNDYLSLHGITPDRLTTMLELP